MTIGRPIEFAQPTITKSVRVELPLLEAVNELLETMPERWRDFSQFVREATAEKLARELAALADEEDKEIPFCEPFRAGRDGNGVN